MQNVPSFSNPFRPGAGHPPPYLAGREVETKEFIRLLGQTIIMENLVLTGLRGVGKTVLLDTFKPKALQKDWLWVGTDLSESASITEENIALRLLTDLSVITSSVVIKNKEILPPGFLSKPYREKLTMDFHLLRDIFQDVPGLVSDKLKEILELAWQQLSLANPALKGIIFAYDEAQNLSDHAQKEQYPLSMILDVFQSIQRKKIPCMLVLTGLPTLFPKLVDARTFSERMFRIVMLQRLTEKESKEAILEPITRENCPIRFSEQSVDTIIKLSGGYPYFIQFICREVYDVYLQKIEMGEKPSVPVDAIIRKLDSDFFAGRWAKATDRQRELLSLTAKLENADQEFTVQEIVDLSKQIVEKPFSSSHVNQMLSTLCNVGLVYKNRYGKYSFAVPLLGKFIWRQISNGKVV